MTESAVAAELDELKRLAVKCVTWLVLSSVTQIAVFAWKASEVNTQVNANTEGLSAMRADVTDVKSEQLRRSWVYTELIDVRSEASAMRAAVQSIREDVVRLTARNGSE